ncbi:unnamed protein product [Didymodactylos carnosus]|uniref:Uncharacterized protein n=2 Tax=Didymodactylos carnosus TaxID=1234261 RepID=A0A813UIM4_9BILA|nr:unnamed protein product [Didymodactylos carnosus]CAF3613329.1 unnamed protein product [Didymodactylos carnosus]
MRNGFGLQYIYQFFNIPYLQLQREALLQQLEVNARDMDQTLEEIDAYEQSQENNYEVFLDQLTQKRRIKQEQLAGDILKQAKPLEEAKKVYNENLLIQQQQQQEAAAKSGKIIPPALNGIVQTLTRKNESTIRHTPTTTTVQSSPNTMKQKPMQAVQPQIQKNLTIDPQPDESTSDITDNTINNFNPLVKTTVDDFIPDDNEYETFLVDDPASMIKSPSTYSTQTQQNKLSTTTDDENETPHINPMVVGFREQLDSDDEQQQQNTTNFDIVRTNSQKISDDEIEEEEEEDKNVQSTKPQSKPNPKSSQTISAPVVPIYNFTSSDLDMLDKMTSFSRQSTLEGSNTKTIDSQSVTSETRSTKKKSKKTSSSQEGSVDSSVKKKHHKKSKQDLSSSDEKKKKSKKTTATKMLKSMSLNEAVSHNDKNDDDKDERDLESFLGETKQHSSGGGQGDYELI